MIGASTEVAIVTSPETLWPFELKNRIRSPVSGRSVAITFCVVPVIAPANARFSKISVAVSVS